MRPDWVTLASGTGVAKVSCTLKAHAPLFRGGNNMKVKTTIKVGPAQCKTVPCLPPKLGIDTP
jgi:hypothetical protein